jgi:hypothetical protein
MLLDTFVETEKTALEKKKLERKRLEVAEKTALEKKELERKRFEVEKSSKALGTFLDSIDLSTISHLPATSSEIPALISKVVSSRDKLTNNEKLLDNLKFAVNVEIFLKIPLCCS